MANAAFGDSGDECSHARLVVTPRTVQTPLSAPRRTSAGSSAPNQRYMRPPPEMARIKRVICIIGADNDLRPTIPEPRAGCQRPTRVRRAWQRRPPEAEVDPEVAR